MSVVPVVEARRCEGMVASWDWESGGKKVLGLRSVRGTLEASVSGGEVGALAEGNMEEESDEEDEGEESRIAVSGFWAVEGWKDS